MVIRRYDADGTPMADYHGWMAVWLGQVDQYCSTMVEDGVRYAIVDDLDAQDTHHVAMRDDGHITDDQRIGHTLDTRNPIEVATMLCNQ
jgi:hypothetical protein